MSTVGQAISGTSVLAVSVIGAVGGALLGAFLGAVAGFTAKVRMDYSEDLWYKIPLKRGDIRVVAHARERAHQAHDVMHRHGVKCFVGESCPESEPAGEPGRRD